MTVVVGFLAACGVLAFLLVRQKLGNPVRDHGDYLGMAGFWVVLLGAALLVGLVLY